MPSSEMSSTSGDARRAFRVSVSKSPEKEGQLKRMTGRSMNIPAKPLSESQSWVTVDSPVNEAPRDCRTESLEAPSFNVTMNFPVFSPLNFSTVFKAVGTAKAGAARAMEAKIAVEKRMVGLIGSGGGLRW